MRSFLVVLFFLVAEGATRDGAFLLSEAELVRVGSSVAYLDISWARVGDCPGKRGRCYILQKRIES
jgi:hypothetical protein